MFLQINTALTDTAISASYFVVSLFLDHPLPTWYTIIWRGFNILFDAVACIPTAVDNNNDDDATWCGLTYLFLLFFFVIIIFAVISMFLLWCCCLLLPLLLLIVFPIMHTFLFVFYASCSLMSYRYSKGAYYSSRKYRFSWKSLFAFLLLLLILL